MSLLKVENLSYSYNKGTSMEKNAVKNASFEIEQGDFIGIIGHTGSGKSTLIQHFNGLIRPDSGRIYINGEDIWASKERLHQIRFIVGLVFQYPEYQLFEETVYKDIAFGPGNMGLGKEEIDARVREAADFAGVHPEYLESSPFDLSGGQKRRAAIAGVIAMRPQILVLDEPAAGLDPHGRDRIFERIKNYHKKTGSTVVLVSHSMEDIARYAKKVLVMNQGGIETFDTVENVFSKAERLLEIGLEVPMITRVFMALRARGIDVPPDVYTVDYGRSEILKLLEREGIKHA
ncbi:MAG: energy-coupling factor transporter ATPase [Oscillospiraceae bacterium]|jgi:energy-coupling factor transport system ATP-binding protein|nr:energy-coupling factor transporter ATPase [Oscillospiraceae bacterium]